MRYHSPPVLHNCTMVVLQDDLHIANLILVETVRYAAMTRILDSVTDEERGSRVQFFFKMLGIDHVNDSLVGNPMIKDISGGQKKWLSVAVEIVNIPNFIFLDGKSLNRIRTISLYYL